MRNSLYDLIFWKLFAVSLLLTVFASVPTANALPAPTNLCIQTTKGKSCAPDQTPRSHGHQMKWHPGHYVMENLKFAIRHKIIKGTQRSYNWGDLEPKKGVYDFSAIEKHLHELKAHGKRLVIKLRYKTFSIQAKRKNCAPKYVHNMGGVKIVYWDDAKEYKHKGHVVRKCITQIWKKPVADRLVAITHALGKRFNNEPYVEAFVAEETAGPAGEGSKYSHKAYLDALKRLNKEAMNAFPNTLVFQQANWMVGGYMNELVKYLQKIGCGLSGPDLMPGRHTESTKLHRLYAGMMPLAIDNQRAKLVGGKSPEAAYRYAVNDPKGLHANYVFWATTQSSPWSFEKNIIPVLKKHNGKINSACPKNIKCNTK